jgi:hypothetical protein
MFWFNNINYMWLSVKRNLQTYQCFDKNHHDLHVFCESCISWVTQWWFTKKVRSKLYCSEFKKNTCRIRASSWYRTRPVSTFRSLGSVVQRQAPTYLVNTDVVHNKVKPEPESWVASVWTDEQIIFILWDQIHASEVTCKEIQISIMMDNLI